MAKLAVAVACAFMAVACDRRPERPAPPPSPHAGFVVKPRPSCTQDVAAAVRAGDIQAVTRLAAQGANFTCDTNDKVPPLGQAVLDDRLDLVRALLDARADANVRWGAHGDHFPLQTAIEGIFTFRRDRYRASIIRSLLQRGADPNARWCAFETRSVIPEAIGCESEKGATPLMFAALANDAEVVVLLLDAGADPTHADRVGANALDYASDEATFYLLLGRIIPPPEWKTRALAYLNARYAQIGSPALWDRTALGRAIAGTHGAFRPPRFPANAGDGPTPAPYLISRARLVRALLALGADPNQRLGAGIADWTPLSLGILHGDRQVVETLLSHGADPNGRWCFPLDPPWRAESQRRLLAPPGCTLQNGMTPLMFVADRGGSDLIAVLLAYGADPRLSDWRQRTAQDYAAGTRAPEIMRMLSERSSYAPQ